MAEAKGADAKGIAIGELSRRTGVNIETVRYYERIGLLRIPARAGRYRRYRPDDERRLNFVRRSRDLGFSLDQVRTLLHLADRRGRSCGKARELALAHLEQVRRKAADLTRLEGVLSTMVARCADGSLPDCPLIEALFDGPVPIGD
jgi:MerR family transcriptional regulator, mercuric resistance operon regulatory protein